MTRYLLSGCFLLAVASIGCGTRTTVAPEAPEATPEDTTTRLGEHTEHTPAEWLKLPRTQLAEKVKEWTETVAKQQDFARGNAQAVLLLPHLRPPAVVSVFGQSQLNAVLGFCVPPYWKEGERDAELALHLARFGDHEAAFKLADPTDGELRARIESSRTEKNYPAEWTQLMGLVLQSAQLKLANGEPEGASEVVLIHKELQQVLDPRAARGPLGAALLSSGRRALTLAASAWREPKLNKTALAQDIETALAAWGDVPAPTPSLRPGAHPAEVARVFGRPVRGRVVTARTPAEVQRALDLLDLAVPAEGVQGVAAFLDEERNLTALIVAYRGKINELFPEPVNLVYPLAEHSFTAGKLEHKAGLLQQTYEGNGLAYDVTLAPRVRGLGALVRVGAARAESPPAVFGRDPRDFGAVHLDCSFEENRRGLAPQEGPSIVTIKQKTALDRITAPVLESPRAAVLNRETGHDLLAQLSLRWPKDVKEDAVTKLVLPLWSAYGNARVEGKEDAEGGRLVLTWEDKQTRVRLRLPYGAEGPELRVEDARGPEGLKDREETTARRDRAERRARLESGRPQTRLTRWLLGLDGVKLGMRREEVQATLPRNSQAVRQQPLTDGVNLLFLTEAPPEATFHARQMFIRYRDGRVAEIRARYQEGPRPTSSRSPTLLTVLKRGPNGVPEERPAPWARLWPDLPVQRPVPVLYRWQDDQTVLTFQRDAGGVEVVVRERGAEDNEEGVLPPLQFCGRGVAGCVLGDARSDVFRHWKVTQPPVVDGAEVLGLPAASPYDLLLVWSENGRVTRLVARHHSPTSLRPKDVGAALQEAWSRDIDHLGVVRRQDEKYGHVLQAYGWHDDVTRVRIFAQEMEDGLRLFTEWRAWPVPAEAVAAKP
jgi:hypothetical protein